MQNRPDQSTLLDALASFLMSEVTPKLEADKALQFRVLIAANLATVVANELRTQGPRDAAERAGLQQVLGPSAASELDLEALNGLLARSLRAGLPLQEATLTHLFSTARAGVEVTNPRFDVSEEPG